MHTESRNHTLSQAEMREHIFIPRKENEKQAFEDMIEGHFLEEEMFNSQLEEMLNSYLEEHFLEEKSLNSIENHFLEADMPEDHFFEDESLNSLIEEYLLKEDIRDSIIEEQALEAEMFNSLLEERIQEYADLYDAIEGFEEDDCDYGPDYGDYHYENEIGIDLALHSPQFEYDDSEDSSCCFEFGYYNDENSTGIFGGYVDMYNPEFVPSFRHINNF